ncbi:MAG: hypothetical protein GOU97_00830 [Nanoarchaeota archaeon]|nr:hypothetical protein [Nanoarchaeota archaeon]
MDKKLLFITTCLFIIPTVIAANPSDIYNGFMEMYYNNQSGNTVMVLGSALSEYKAPPETVNPFQNVEDDQTIYVDVSMDGEITQSENTACTLEHTGKRCVKNVEEWFTGTCGITGYDYICPADKDCYGDTEGCWRLISFGLFEKTFRCPLERKNVYDCSPNEWNSRTGIGCEDGQCMDVCNNGEDDDMDGLEDGNDEDCQGGVQEPMSCSGVNCAGYNSTSFINVSDPKILCCMNFPNKMEKKILSLPIKFTFAIKGDTSISHTTSDWPLSWETNWDAEAGTTEWNPSGDCYVDPYVRDEDENIVVENGIKKWKNCGSVQTFCQDSCDEAKLNPSVCLDLVEQEECYLKGAGKHAIDSIPQEDVYTDLSGDKNSITINRMDKTFSVFDEDIISASGGDFTGTGYIYVQNAKYKCTAIDTWQECELESVSGSQTSIFEISKTCSAGNEASYDLVREWKYCYDYEYDYDVITSADYGQNVPIPVYENKLGFLDYNYFPYCGNGVAETDLGENCENCPQDMSISYCPLYDSEEAICNPNCPAQDRDACGYMIRIDDAGEELMDNEQEIKMCFMNKKFDYSGENVKYYDSNKANNAIDGGMIQRSRNCLESNWLGCCWWMLIPGFGQVTELIGGVCANCLTDVCMAPRYPQVRDSMQECIQKYESKVSASVAGKECTSSCECQPGSTCSGLDQTPGKYCCPKGTTWTPLGCERSVGDYNVQKIMDWAERTYICDVIVNFGQIHFIDLLGYYTDSNYCHPYSYTSDTPLAVDPYELHDYPDNDYQYPMI